MTAETIDGALVMKPDFKHLDTLSARDFSAEYDPAAAASDRVILDLSLVQFVDSTGLGAILNLVRDTLARGARIAICCAQPSVKLLFKMVQLSKLVTILDTRELALAWAGS